MLPLITLLIPTYNSEKYLAQCLNSIKLQDYPQEKLDVIIIDNGSSDQSVEIAKSFAFKVISAPGNISKLRNLIVEHSNAEIFAFVDSDCSIKTNWCRKAAELLSNNKIGAVGASLLYSKQESFIGSWLNNQANYIKQDTSVSWVASAAIAVPSKIFLELQGFDEKLVTCEDVDFCYRLGKSGYQIIASKDLVPLHYGDPPCIWGLIKKEYWRAQDSLVLLFKYPNKSREFLSNTYQLWFWIIFLVIIYAALTLKLSLLLSLLIVLLPLPALIFSIRAFLQDNKKNFKELLLFYCCYYCARSLAFPKSVLRVFQYFKL